MLCALEPVPQPCALTLACPRSQAIRRFEEIDRLIQWGMLPSTDPKAFFGVFAEAREEVENLEIGILQTANKAAAVRPGALGKVRSRDPHFGKKVVRLYKPDK